MSIKLAAAHLSVDENTIRDAINKQELRAVRIGPKRVRWSIEVVDLMDWYHSLNSDRPDAS